jgi:hypothetical protein
MQKPFLLIAGAGYYPESGTGDWIGCYETEKEALEQVEFKEIHQYYSKGKNKGEIKSTHTTYVVKGGEYDRHCDWYEIIDLRDWTER